MKERMSAAVRRLGLVAAIGAAMVLTAYAEKVTLPVWPNGAPEENGLKVENENWNGTFLNQTASAELYVFPAKRTNSDANGTAGKDPDRGGKAVLMCPGGGYWGLAMGHEGLDMADWFNSMGITYAVLKYRMPNGHHTVPLSDAEQAMRIIRDHASEWGVNPDSIGVMGASAGGHLASTLATHASSPETRPAFQILFYPVITMEPGVTHQGSHDFLLGKSPDNGATPVETPDQAGKQASAPTLESTPEKARVKALETLYSNETQVTATTPPAFIMVSADDDVVPLENSLRYATALSKNGVPFSLHVYPTGGHGWGYGDGFRYKPEWTAELTKWLQTL